MTSDMHALNATIHDLGLAESLGRQFQARGQVRPLVRSPRDEAHVEGVSIVVLSCNHPEYFTRLADQIPPCGDVLLETILVHNGRDRETADAADLRGWTVLPGLNRSFAGGCDDAVAESHSSHVLLLSDDAEVTPAALDLLWARRCYPLVAPVIVGRSGLVNCAGGVLDADLRPTHLARDERLDRLDRRDRFCPWATGAALLIARQLWDELGGFDEAYPGFGGYEDADLCFRAGERGVRPLIAGQAVIQHDDHGSRAGTDESRNRARFEATWIKSGRLRRLLGLA